MNLLQIKYSCFFSFRFELEKKKIIAIALKADIWKLPSMKK